MNGFLEIKTLFETDSERTIEELSKTYSDRKKLQTLFSELVYDSLLKNGGIKDKKILLKPNWVKHSLQPYDELCLRTNDDFLLAFLELLLQFAPQSILIGDAPIQGCKWDKMLSKEFLSEIQCLSERYNIPIRIKDFRRVTLDVRKNKLTKECNPLNEYLLFDLGDKSYLEPISNNARKFRVTDYNYDRLGESHRKGVHKYCITKEFFNADIIISIPKIKTHQKTGITCALKNIVGINGDKDFLPHHRLGGTGQNGDCYPGKNYFRYYAEKLRDIANRNIGRPQFWFWQKLAIFLWKLSNPKPIHQIAAGWYGNDTCWRMVMDLNKIAVYGTANGEISDNPQRIIYTLCDGIIGGQGNGPLEPNPLPLGIISFSTNSAITDMAMATLMDFDIHKISLLHAAETGVQKKDIKIFLNNHEIEINDLKSFAISTVPPPGWIDYLGQTNSE